MNIVVVDDQDDIRYSVAKILTEEGHKVYQFCGSESDIVDRIESLNPILLLLDVNLGFLSGIDILSYLKDKSSPIGVVLMTAFTTPSNIIEATRLGVRDVLKKPFNAQELVDTVSKYAKKNSCNEHFILEATGETFVGSYDTMGEIYKQIGVVASNNLSVMIKGETGSGKELVAKLVHSHSSRSKKSFLAINCAAIPSELFESEFFGHERGSFTGADKQHIGYLESANGGTVFLDEIGEMPLFMQAKLLRFLESRRIKRVGGTKDIELDIRIVSATNIDINRSITDGNFREDLYYRLSSLIVDIPPLRERRGDIPLLAGHFIKLANRELACSIKSVSDEAMSVLKEHSWYGNVRELKNVIVNASLQAVGGVIEKKDIAMFRNSKAFDGDMRELVFSLLEKRGLQNAQAIFKEFEKELIKTTIDMCSGNIAKASSYLGISRNTIKAKLK